MAILGIPFDEATTSRSGARFGPRGIRDVSTFWAYRAATLPYLDGEVGAGKAREVLGGVRLVDCGDVSWGRPSRPTTATPPWWRACARSSRRASSPSCSAATTR